MARVQFVGCCVRVVGERTPGRSPDLESCIRTLMVSSGWHASFFGGHHGRELHVREESDKLLTASIAPARPPAVMCVAKPTGFFDFSKGIVRGGGGGCGSSDELDEGGGVSQQGRRGVCWLYFTSSPCLRLSPASR